jgi:hypothetical protein
VAVVITLLSMKRFLRRLLFLFLGLLVVYVLALAVLSIQPYVKDTDLQVTRELVPGESNAFAGLEKAASLLWWPQEIQAALGHLAADTNWDAGLASSALASNQQALATLDAALALSALQVPEFRLADKLPYLSDWKRLAQLQAIRANSLFRAGREQEAFNQAVNLVQMGRRIEDAKGGVIHYLVGAGVKGQGFSCIRRWVGRTRLTPQQIARIISALKSVPADGSALTEALKVEYQVQIQTLADIRAGRVEPGLEEARLVRLKLVPVYNHAKTKRLFATSTRALIDSVEVPYAKAKLLDAAKRPSPAQLILGGNLAGEVIYWLTMPANGAAITRKCEESVQLEATCVLLALRAYQLKNGRLPDSLSALVPEFLDAVPADDFDGQPLRYSPAKKVIYSVGKDLRDDQGDITKTQRQSPDYGFSIDL